MTEQTFSVMGSLFHQLYYWFLQLFLNLYVSGMSKQLIGDCSPYLLPIKWDDIILLLW